MTASVTGREPQQDRSRATRQGLLESAIASLAEVGWSASTVASVAERAGVSRGAAQHHFPTREDLFIAAVEHVSETRADEINRAVATRGQDQLSTHEVLTMVVDLYTSELFRAALVLWVASAAEPQLQERVIALETRFGRQMHRATAQLLDVDESVPGVRELIQATLDLARGLGLANLLTDDRRRRGPIVAQWADVLDRTLDRRID
jgi:AcrR family transcriptional regulator